MSRLSDFCESGQPSSETAHGHLSPARYRLYLTMPIAHCQPLLLGIKNEPAIRFLVRVANSHRKCPMALVASSVPPSPYYAPIELSNPNMGAIVLQVAAMKRGRVPLRRKRPRAADTASLPYDSHIVQTYPVFTGASGLALRYAENKPVSNLIPIYPTKAHFVYSDLCRNQPLR